jgi:predicted membrane channel-forming protein YqfA (hemolysin III family)
MPVVEQVTIKTESKRAARNATAQIVSFIVGIVLIVLLAVGFLVFVYVVGQGLAGRG